MDEIQINRFEELFIGNKRSFIETIVGGKTRAVKETVKTENYTRHLLGEARIGVSPILDTNDCWFGAIDVDCHGEEQKEIDLESLEKSAKTAGLPLVICRSKSGGAHCYVFLVEPVKAKTMRSALASWSTQLGFAGVEIFPKQEKLHKDSAGETQHGSCINLPYFNSADSACYCFEGGKKREFEYFLDLAESMRISPSMVVEKSESQHQDAPPCVQKMISEDVGHGQRNLAMFNICVYAKQAFPETWKDKVFDINAKNFASPLGHSEVKSIVQSVSRREYRYKCKEEPCRSRCNSAKCVERKFGITSEEKGELEVGEMPTFGNLKKFMTDPVKWSLTVDGKEIVMSTSTLMDFRLVRMAIADSLTKLVPPMKGDRWASILAPLMTSAKVVEAPQDASNYGIVLSRLSEFVQKADLTASGEDLTKRSAILRGSPVVQLREDKKVVYFRGTDFKEYLKKTRSDELRGVDLWMHLKDYGVSHGKLRIGKTLHNVWHMDLTEDMIPELRNMEQASEF